MADIQTFIREATALQGVTGNEHIVARYIADAFRPYCDDVKIDTMNNVIAHRAGHGPKIMLAAHLDEIGLCVRKIDEDGGLRLANMGGVDPRILPGLRLNIHGTETLLGIVGAKPPHLMTADEQKKNYTRDDLYVDTGLPADEVKKLVRVGDRVTFRAPLLEMKNERFACKTIDDRGCVAIMLSAAEKLCGMVCEADVYFVATAQEEIGSYGALTASYGLYPDIGIALDVCHAATPGANPDRTHELGCVVATQGPFIQLVLYKRLMDTARDNGVKVNTGVSARHTSTDADDLAMARDGVPTVLLELPLKYMHTTVETFDMHALTECARLLTLYIAGFKAGWEESLWI